MSSNVTVVGNVTRDPEIRYTPSGAAVCNLGIADNRKWRDRDGNEQESVSFFDVAVWGDLGENVAASVRKGQHVIVSGSLEQRSWETPTGEQRSKVEIKALAVGLSLRFGTAEFRGEAKRGGSAQPAAQPAAQPDYDEEPF